MVASLLFVEENARVPRIDEQFFQTIRLTPLFNEQTLKLLCMPCTREELNLRHFLFRRLQDKKFRAVFEELSVALNALHQACQSYQKDSSNCERLLAFFQVARRFCTAFRLADRLVDDPTQNSALQAFLEFCDRQRPIIEELEPHLEELKQPLQDIITSKLFFSPAGVTLTENDASEGLIASLNRYAAELEICNLTLPPQRTLSLPQELSAALLHLYPEQFTHLLKLEGEFRTKLDFSFLKRRDELMFYQNVLSLIDLATARGIPHTLPKLSDAPVFSARQAYDVSLFKAEGIEIVPNDISFTQDESFFFLTGANGGGKTTYLRTVAANLVLAVCGCPVFAESAIVSPFGGIGAHFPNDETTESGRLIEEQRRVEDLFAGAAAPAFLFFNETFSGANDQKGLVLTLDCADRCRNEGIFGLFVTHFHEVNGHDFPVLSTVIDPENNNRRTYRIVRNTGLRSSYAEDILRKYRLSADTLSEREEVHT